MFFVQPCLWAGYREGHRSPTGVPRGRPLECRAAGGGVRGRDRRVPGCGSGPAAGVPTAAPGAANARALPWGVLPTENPVWEHRRA